MIEKPFLVFAGMDFEASGGMSDCVGRFATLEDARAGLQEAIDTRWISHDWHHIANLATGEIVEHTEMAPRFNGFTVIGPPIATYVRSDA